MSLFLTDLPNYAFLQYAVLAAILASVAGGIVGTYVVVRRRTYIVGAISHSLLGGMSIARYFHTVHGVSWATPLAGATITAVLVAVIIALVTTYGGQREDTILSAIWAVGMAVGVSFISITPGYSEDLMSYLFGNILMVAKQDLVLMLILNSVIVVMVVLFYDRFLAISFHEESARLRGISVGLYSVILLLLTALTIVLLVQVVGIVMVIALLALPAATALQLARRLWQVILLAVGLSLLFTLGGLVCSYGPNLPAGATIIELAGGVYLLVMIGKIVVRRYRRAGLAAKRLNPS
jgi:zinc transport system permease protein